MTPEDLYDGREQSRVKHFILREYLCEFAHKIGSRYKAINYVDCFSGPWNVSSNELADSSFAIALAELKKARHTLQGQGRDFDIRCFFLERNAEAYSQLDLYAASQDKPGTKVRAVNKSLTDAIPDIRAFIAEGGSDSFTFLFIDPTGWSGLDMADITPFLQLASCEVLVNFMTGHIRRFFASPKPDTAESFRRFFGVDGLREWAVAIEDFQLREDFLLHTYATQVGVAGNYPYTSAAIVLKPLEDRTHFHLVYATRNPIGIEVFKRVEKKAMDLMQEARAHAKEKQQIRQTGQPSLFRPEALISSGRLDELKSHYVQLAREEAGRRLRKSKQVGYDVLFAEALRYPLVWEADLKEWIKEWRATKNLTLHGLQEGQRVPRVNAGNELVWNDVPTQGTMFG